MDITLISKARFDALMQDIKNLENQVQMAHTQLKAMQETNNNFADIAFDENRFTDELISRCEEAAREAASDAIDIDDIASKVTDEIDLSEDVRRAVDNMEFVDADKVNDLVEEYVNDNNLLNTDEVEEVVEDYIQRNCDFVESDAVEDMVRDVVNEMVEERTLDVTDLVREVVKEEITKTLQLIANKLTERREATPTPSADLNGHTQPNAQ